MDETCFADGAQSGQPPCGLEIRCKPSQVLNVKADLLRGATRRVLAKQWQRSGISDASIPPWRARTSPCSTRRDPSIHNEYWKAGVPSRTRSGIYRVRHCETHCGASVQPSRSGSDLQVRNGTSPETPTVNQTAAGESTKQVIYSTSLSAFD